MKKTNIMIMASAALILAACGGSNSHHSAPEDSTPTQPKPTQEASGSAPAKTQNSNSGNTNNNNTAKGGKKTSVAEEIKEDIKPLVPFINTQKNYVELVAATGANNAPFTRKTVNNATESSIWNRYHDDAQNKTITLMPEKNITKKELAIEVGAKTDYGQLAMEKDFVGDKAKNTTFYLSQEYSYSRFGSIDERDQKRTTYYSVGSFLLPKNTEEVPVKGSATYEGIAFLDSENFSDPLIGQFIGDAQFSKKEFTGKINELKRAGANNLDIAIKGNLSDADAAKFYAQGEKFIVFNAKINGNHFESDPSAKVKAAGSFYGPQAAEVGGVLSGVGSDDSITFKGAFGGKKQ